MRSLLCGVLGVGLLTLLGTTAPAVEADKSLQPGDNVGAFYVTKCAGAEEDKVAIDDTICYRCKYGARPQVMIFTRSTDERVVKLIQQLDEQVKTHAEAQLKAFVNVLGADKQAAMDNARKLAGASQATLIPLVVPVDHQQGPENYALDTKAELIVLVANEGKVVANLPLASVKDLDLRGVLETIRKVVN